MKARERVLATLSHEPTDKIPFSIGYDVNEYTCRQLTLYLNRSEDEIKQILHDKSDMRKIYPVYTGLSYRGPQFITEKPDIWGVSFKTVFNGFDYDSLNEIITRINLEDEHAIAIANGNIIDKNKQLI